MDLNRLLHPNLLSSEELLQVLESLCIKVSPDLPKCQLLEIFNKVAVPLPQRNHDRKSQFEKNTAFDDDKVSTPDDCSMCCDDEDDISNPTKMKFICNEEIQDMEELKRQLSHVQLKNESNTLISNLNNFQYQSNSIPTCNVEKVILKRSHLFQKDNNEYKRKKLY